jgi:excisionase family DNA binding protein
MTDGEDMTAQDAANVLGISRTHLNVLLERELIPHTETAGGHHQISKAGRTFIFCRPTGALPG